MKKLLLIASALLAPLPALGAAQTNAQLHSSVNTNIVAGVPDGIRASTLNTILNNIIDSMMNSSDAFTVTGAATFSGPTTFNVAPRFATFSNCYIRAAGASVATCDDDPWHKSLAGTSQNATASGFSAANQALWLVGTFTGTGDGPYALISIADTATDTDPSHFVSGLWLAHNVGLGAGEGSRNTFRPILTIANAIPCSPGGSNCFHITSFPQAYVSANLGGSVGDYRGDVYGAGALAQLMSGATYVHGVIGEEHDVSVQTGASVDYKSIASFISVNSDAVGGNVFNAMVYFAADNTSSYRWPKGITFGVPAAQWPFDASSNMIDTTAPGSGSRVALNGVDFSDVTFSGCSFKSDGFCINPIGAFDDQSSVTGSAPKFFADSYYGNAATGIVHKMNRLFVGEASHTPGGLVVGGDSPPASWTNDYSGGLVSLSALAVVNPIGTLGIMGAARTSDYRGWIGASSGGSQGITGIGVDDDTLGAAIACGVCGIVTRRPGTPGISLNQFDATNSGTNVDADPYTDVTGGSTWAMGLTSGSYPKSGDPINNATGALYLGGNVVTGGKFRKGIIVLDTALDHTLGISGGGIFAELPEGAELRWLNSGHASIASIDATGSLLNLRGSVYSTASIAAASTITAGTALLATTYVKTGAAAIASLPTCNGALLGGEMLVSNGTSYAVGLYGTAVSATGAVTRKAVCTNTAGPTTYAWAYN